MSKDNLNKFLKEAMQLVKRAKGRKEIEEKLNKLVKKWRLKKRCV